jgi:hypothetical protein
VDTITEAQGLIFLCPKCFAANKGPVGTHAVICWSRSRGVPDEAKPSGRWTLDGTGMNDLTLNGDPPGSARSVLLKGGCAWHGHITNGEVTYQVSITHKRGPPRSAPPAPARPARRQGHRPRRSRPMTGGIARAMQEQRRRGAPSWRFWALRMKVLWGQRRICMEMHTPLRSAA